MTTDQLTNDHMTRSVCVYLTAGAAGMYCGSCLHDNTLAAALVRLGVDIQLIPTYTPIRTDEQDVSADFVFFGGINVYLQQKSALFRWLPSALDRILDRPWLLRRATVRSTAIDPKFLGDLAVSMLRGEHGYQRKEVRRLCRFLASDVRPNLVVLTNMLIGGCIPELKRTLGVPVLVTLQGDDAFLEYLPEPHKTRCFEQIRRLVRDVDGFLVHSRYYAEFMTGYFGIPPDKLHVVPLGIDTRDFAEPDRLDRIGVADGPSRAPARARRRSATWRVWPRKRACTCWPTRSSNCGAGPAWTTSSSASPAGWANRTARTPNPSSTNCGRRAWGMRFNTWAKWTGGARRSSCGRWTSCPCRRPSGSRRACSSWSRWRQAFPWCCRTTALFPS